MASYPYAAPPPAPASSATPPASYPSYNQPSTYNAGSHRGGHPPYSGGGRGRGHHDYGSNSRYYPQPDYAPAPPGGPYSASQASAHWQSAPPANHYSQQGAPHHPPSTYPPGYNSQPYSGPVGQGYQSQYPSAPVRHAPSPQYPTYSNDHPSQRWPEQAQNFQPYSNRGGRGGFQSDRGGHKPENSMAPPTAMRMGFEHNGDRTAHTSSPYGPPYQAGPQPGPYAQPPYPYPASENPYSTPSHAPHPTHGYTHRGGSGRDGFGHSGRGGRGGHNNRGEKFRQREHKPSHGFNPAQKPDAAVHSKKKKRKVGNTLGLTPGDASSEDEDGLDDEEKRLSELLGADAPVIPDIDAWIAERKANFPTKARVEAKKAAAAASAPKADDSSKTTTTKIDKDQAKIDRLEKKLSKLKGSLEKRKRADNDEGDEMRADGSPGLSDSSSDEEPEVQSSSKPPTTTLLPPPPITRADISNHCKYYSTGGTCGKKGKCRFKHDPAVREAALQERSRNGGRMTLKQRMVLNDKTHEDMDVVKTIVEMRSTGRLADPQNLQVRAKHQADEKAITSPVLSTLPSTAGIASLPPNPYASSKKTATQK
ncbi:hypothetical protein F4777DRAFT_578453 [Nemania sp. FL0916]|nr:hypothetical protein F4777DRAFT_578453 [Nemania sp. FL0916]